MKKLIIILSLLLFSCRTDISLKQENIELKKQISELEAKIKNLTPSNTINQKVDEKCKTSKSEIIVDGTSMEPLLRNTTKQKVENNYYKCGWFIKRWDILLINNSATWYKNYVKKLVVLPWDIIKFNESWNIILNWDILKNSENKEYIFTKNEVKIMSLYIVNWVLQEWTYFVFWDNITNSRDSRNFWWVWVEWFIWKVEIK